MSDQEKKDKRFSIIVSAIVHSSLIALFLLLVAWREPDPPIPEYGIELNLGFQDQGSGNTEREFDASNEEIENDVQPDTETETENNEVEEVQEEQVQEETVEETTTEAETETTEEVQEQEAPPVEEIVEESMTTEETSEVEVEKEEPPVEETKEEVKEETPPVEEKKEEEKQQEEEKVEEKKQEVIDNRAVMGGKKSDTKSEESASNNQGESDAKGNEGDPEGNKETKGTNPGGADLGVSYSLDGWKWQSPPTEKDDSQIEGTIKFAIDVDDRGRVQRVTVIPGTTISDNTIIDFYKKQVMDLVFLQTDPTKAPAAISKGEVTFKIKTT